MKMHVLAAAFLAALASDAVLAEDQSMPRVEITAPARSDTAIAAEVRQKINERPSLRLFGISVRSADHAVYLEGLVDTRLDSDEAEDIARGVPGVRNVHNELSGFNG